MNEAEGTQLKFVCAWCGSPAQFRIFVGLMFGANFEDHLKRLVYTSIQVAANQSLGKLLATGNLHLPVQLGNREIHSRSKRETIRNDNISQQ